MAKSKSTTEVKFLGRSYEVVATETFTGTAAAYERWVWGRMSKHGVSVIKETVIA